MIALVAFFLSACSSVRKSGGYFENDGPHENVRVDVSNVADAIPTWERINPSRSRPYTVLGKKYYPMIEARNYRQIGVASWYGRKFHGRLTALGERYDMYAMTAAHTTLPLPTFVRVRNLENNLTVTVRVNDRGPFLHNRLIDLSYAAAYKLKMLNRGTADVEVTVVTPGSRPTPSRETKSATVGKPVINSTEELRSPSAEDVITRSTSFIYLQIGAFSDAKNAERLRSRLEQAHFSPVSILPVEKNNSQLYRVRIGPLESMELTQSIRDQLAKSGFSNAQLIHE